MEIPEIRYAKSGDVSIAYEILGDGPFDLVFTHGWLSNIAYVWEQPRMARFYRRLASFSRLILYDKRGVGLSDRVSRVTDIDERMDDMRAVMDAAGSERAALFGASEGGAVSMLFSATYPARTTALVVYGGLARVAWAPDYPWGDSEEEVRAYCDSVAKDWGTRECADDWVDTVMPSAADDEDFKRWFANFCRLSATPADASALEWASFNVDIRDVLPAIRVPTLILHRRDDLVDVRHGRYLAEHIPGAKYVELEGGDHAAFVGASDVLVDEVEEFLTGVRRAPDPDRVLATVLFTDIVGASERAAELGDRVWRERLERHHVAVRRELARFGGVEIDTAGDGFFASFDGPARAIRCARAIADSVMELGLEVRCGLHTGECELLDGKVAGIAVHTGARVASIAQPGEVLVSSTVKDLVAGSGITFEHRGEHVLKGIPGEWKLFAADRVTV